MGYITLIWEFIKKYGKLIEFVVIIGLAVGLLFSVKSCSGHKAEQNRLLTNQTALMSDIETYKTESGKNAARVTELELTRGEFERLCNEQMATIEDLNLKVRRLESISTTGTETNVTAGADIRDTVFVTRVDSVMVRDTAQYFKWADNWNEISGVIKDNHVDCEYHGSDTLNIVVSRAKKKCLFKPTYYQVDIVNQNPSTSVTYNRTIKLTKRKR